MSERTGSRLRIGPGNSKLGQIPNLSLTPIDSCRADAPCKIDCYANKSYRMYPNVRNAWDGNLAYYQEDPAGFFEEFDAWLAENDPAAFRIHVAGDVPDENYFKNLCTLAVIHSATTFIMFTKRYDLPFELAPDNLRCIISMWPGLDLPARLDHLPKAWLADDLRSPIGQPFISCPGKCDQCSACWKVVSADLPVVFKRH